MKNEFLGACSLVYSFDCVKHFSSLGYYTRSVYLTRKLADILKFVEMNCSVCKYTWAYANDSMSVSVILFWSAQMSQTSPQTKPHAEQLLCHYVQTSGRIFEA
jgi:predicted nucleic-acid-binding Zn-ribbon protein